MTKFQLQSIVEAIYISINEQITKYDSSISYKELVRNNLKIQVDEQDFNKVYQIINWQFISYLIREAK